VIAILLMDNKLALSLIFTMVFVVDKIFSVRQKIFSAIQKICSIIQNILSIMIKIFLIIDKILWKRWTPAEDLDTR